MKIIIAGGRDFDDYGLLYEKMEHLLSNIKDKITIISGTAVGADSLGERYAKEKGYELLQFPADWNNINVEPCVVGVNKKGIQYNKLAGHARNQQMVNIADLAVFFWDNESTGTKDCINRCKTKGIKHKIVIYKTFEKSDLWLSFKDSINEFVRGYDFNIKTIKESKLIADISSLYKRISLLEKDVEDLEEEIGDLEEEYCELEEKFEAIDSQFPKVDGNDYYKLNVLSKAYKKYNVNELEERLNLDSLPQ